MHSKLALLAALSAGLLPIAALAQPPAAPEPAAPTPATAAAEAVAPPHAYPAKIALIAFQQAVIATNEGEQTLSEVRKKYEPKQAQLEVLSTKIDALKKEMQAAPATMTDTERAAKMKTLDSDEKQLDSETETARNAYQADLQDAYTKVAGKVHKVLVDYVKNNGYTILFDVSNEQSSIMWTSQNPSNDITMAVVKAYNEESGVKPPMPNAPAPAASHTRPAGSTTHTAKPSTK